MAINQKGAVIPYQPTYSIQYKYGDRYGPQSFASPTTALGTTGQTGGPLSSQATLDQTTGETANPVVSAEGGDGETLDSKAEGAPGGTGGADFSQFRNQYTPVQPDFGWQYSSTYGDDEYRDPSVGGIFDPPEVPPELGFGAGIIDSGDGGDDTNGQSSNSKDMGLETDLPAQEEITYGNQGVGNEVGDPTAPSVDTSIDDVGSEEDPDDPTDTEGGVGQGISDISDEDYGDSAPSEPASDPNEGVYSFSGGKIPAFGIKKKNKDIPNPLLQDPLADLFRRA